MDDNSYLRTIKIPLIVVGLWRFENQHDTASHRTYFFYSIVVKVFYAFFVAGMIGKTPQIMGSDRQLYEHVSFINVHIIGIVKLLITMTKEVNSLLDEITADEREVMNSSQATIRKIYMKSSGNTRRVQMIFTGNMIFLVLAFVSGFLASARDYFKKVEQGIDTEIPMLFQTWFPLDGHSHFFIVWVYELICVGISGSFLVATDCLIVGLIIYCSYQFELVEHLIRDYDYYIPKTTNEDYDSTFEHFRMCAIKFDHSIKFVRRLDNSIKIIMFFDFLIRSSQIASILFQMIEIGLAPTLLFLIFFFFLNSLQIFLFYWFANEITVNGLAVSNCIYDTKWYGHSKSVKSMLQIMMVRSQRQVQLHIGPLHGMSNDVLLKMAKSIYTYLAVIQDFSRPVSDELSVEEMGEFVTQEIDTTVSI